VSVSASFAGSESRPPLQALGLAGRIGIGGSFKRKLDGEVSERTISARNLGSVKNKPRTRVAMDYVEQGQRQLSIEYHPIRNRGVRDTSKSSAAVTY
jgi:hypothetical protein